MTDTVQYWKDKNLLIDNQILDNMKEYALNNGANKFRYCFHENEQSAIHEMLFTNTKNCYFRPHKHNHDELQIMVDGEMYVVFFNNDGKIIRFFRSAPYDNRIYRINEDEYHVNIPLTDTITILEIKPGPFTQESNVYPDWAPDGSDIINAMSYTSRLVERLENE